MVDLVYRIALCIITVFSSICVNAQNIEPRIAGLESNDEYMSLLKEDSQLRQHEDSILRAIDQIRAKFSTDTDAIRRDEYASEIIDLESQIFKNRNAQGRVAIKVNSIEQDWVLIHLDSAHKNNASTSPKNVTPDSLKVRNLIFNTYFANNLDIKDYQILKNTQTLEMQAVNYVNKYFNNYNKIADLAKQYVEIATEKEAIVIFDSLTYLQNKNNILNDSLAKTWSYIFDNKGYAYGYVLEKRNRDDLLTAQSENIDNANSELLTLDDNIASKAIAEYFINKKVIVEYEILLAEILSLDSAIDSLRGVFKQLGRVDFKLPKIDVVKRFFIDYKSISYPPRTPYSYQNPIPECTIYQNGTIYRILLGAFNTKRAAATFRGAVPLSYIIDDNKKWNYYAGGFATLAEAEQAETSAKKRGFLRPEIIVWRDGVMHNLTKNPELTAATQYRIEITTSEPLLDGVKNIVAEFAKEQELSRIDQSSYIVGVFPTHSSAQAVVDAIKSVDSGVQIKISTTKIEDNPTAISAK